MERIEEIEEVFQIYGTAFFAVKMQRDSRQKGAGCFETVQILDHASPQSRQ